MPFSLQVSNIHLTYRDHQDHEALKQFVKVQLGKNGKTDKETFNWWTIVWEEGHEETPYAHTHFAFGLRQRRHITNGGLFDFNGVHPHIQPLNSKLHQRNCWKYQEKAPIKLSRSDTGPTGATDITTIEKNIRSARTLYDACRNLGIEPKTVSDVCAIRRDTPRPEPYVHKYSECVWNLQLRKAFKCLFVYGPTGTGKTQWAVHCFSNPLLVSHIDNLRDFDADFHDGIVFDDMSFTHMPLQAAIHLLDWDEDRSIHCRFHCATIPAGTKKIFTSNYHFEETFPTDTHGALRRRITEIIHVTGPTWNPNAIGGTQEENAEQAPEEEIGDDLAEFAELFGEDLISLGNLEEQGGPNLLGRELEDEELEDLVNNLIDNF